jgi:hypothetical protein
MMESVMAVVLFWTVKGFRLALSSSKGVRTRNQKIKYEKAVIVKNDRQTYAKSHMSSCRLARQILDGLPLARGDTGSESIAQLTCHCDPDIVRRSNLKDCRGSTLPNISVTLSRQSRDQGLKKRCRTEFGMTDSLCGDPPLGKPPTGFSESDVGEKPGVECDVGQTLDGLVSAELETTLLTDDEVRNDCGLTMEQAVLRNNKPPSLDIDRCLERTSTQQSIVFQYTVSIGGRNISRSPMIEAIQAARSTLPESSGSELLNVNKLWLEVGKTYSNFSECDFTAAINSAGPKASQRIGNWHQFVLPIPLSVNNWAEWDSVMVESVRLILQRWSRVNSFSSTICCTCEKSEHEIVHFLHTGENKST